MVGATVEVDEVSPLGACTVCSAPPRTECGTCVRRSALRRRQAAVDLVRSGASIRQAARATGADRGTIRRALDDRRCTIPNAQLREVVERAIERDPRLSLSEIARRAEPPLASATTVARLLGRIKTSACRRNGRDYPARFRTEIDVEQAARIVHASGIDPIEIDGL